MPGQSHGTSLCRRPGHYGRQALSVVTIGVAATISAAVLLAIGPGRVAAEAAPSDGHQGIGGEVVTVPVWLTTLIPMVRVPAPLVTVRPPSTPSPRPAGQMTPRPSPGRPGAATGRPVSVAPPAPPGHSLLVSADGTLRTQVGTYSDCSGRAPVPTAVAAIDVCMGGVTYFLGHNPGVFTPLMHLGVGSELTWWDASGSAHRLRVAAVRRWTSSAGTPPRTSPDVVAQFQTCITPDGSVDRILDAVAA